MQTGFACKKITCLGVLWGLSHGPSALQDSVMPRLWHAFIGLFKYSNVLNAVTMRQMHRHTSHTVPCHLGEANPFTIKIVNSFQPKA